MELIDGNALEKAIYEWMPKDQETWMDSKIPPIENLVVSIMMTIQEQPTVDAIPVSYIQQRIDHLHKLAEYEFEYNGGYVGATHIAWHELEKILIEWKEERDANQDKTD